MPAVFAYSHVAYGIALSPVMLHWALLAEVETEAAAAVVQEAKDLCRRGQTAGMHAVGRVPQEVWDLILVELRSAAFLRRKEACLGPLRACRECEETYGEPGVNCLPEKLLVRALEKDEAAEFCCRPCAKLAGRALLEAFTESTLKIATFVSRYGLNLVYAPHTIELNTEERAIISHNGRSQPTMSVIDVDDLDDSGNKPAFTLRAADPDLLRAPTEEELRRYASFIHMWGGLTVSSTAPESEVYTPEAIERRKQVNPAVAPDWRPQILVWHKLEPEMFR
ncbi:hypothetical protein Rhopal_005307-T1 [Rhodotorula paludigena]|uniref:Uncharacterized protein n=1 Tax=Rhodotorula paludigena TaxID=86838 RepID=A0AAV5GSE3_9BASI|nr:hypothetical protein Rhopal_005307-T1 [Rhodotorula paludigena]